MGNVTSEICTKFWSGKLNRTETSIISEWFTRRLDGDGDRAQCVDSCEHALGFRNMWGGFLIS
jgi:hypothetical protein